MASCFEKTRQENTQKPSQTEPKTQKTYLTPNRGPTTIAHTHKPAEAL
jgi:hypothetical protein